MKKSIKIMVGIAISLIILSPVVTLVTKGVTAPKEPLTVKIDESETVNAIVEQFLLSQNISAKVVSEVERGEIIYIRVEATSGDFNEIRKSVAAFLNKQERDIYVFFR